MATYYLAVDIGASSGRHILGHMENGKMVLEEIYRFENGMVMKDGELCWEFDRLFKEVVNGAVHTMGKGVSDQISTKSPTTSVKITKRLDTATQTSTHKKEQKTIQSTIKQKQKTQKVSSGQYKSYTYTVKSGETLVSISRKVYGTQKLVQRIKKANALSDENQIYPGQKLIIPGTLR